MSVKKEAKTIVEEKEIDLDEIADNTLLKSAIFTDPERFEFGQRAAKLLASSKFVPETFRNSIGDCVIALNMAERLDVDPVLLMQHLFIIHGRPGMDAQMSIALFNRQKKYTPIWYEESGTGAEYQMVAKTTDRTTGKELEGPPITAKMVQAEGWIAKNGSKWKTIPELMYRYRSAAWLIRTVCPEAVMGLLTVEELRDMDPVNIGTTPTSPKEPEPKDEPDETKEPKDAAGDDSESAAFMDYMEARTENPKSMGEVLKKLKIDENRMNEEDAMRAVKVFRAEMKKK